MNPEGIGLREARPNGHVSSDSIYTNRPELADPQRREARWCCQGLGAGVGSDAQGYGAHFGVTSVLEPDKDGGRTTL